MAFVLATRVKKESSPVNIQIGRNLHQQNIQPRREQPSVHQGYRQKA
jgi:hypothetical protein